MLIFTDGVFSMDGTIARLDKITRDHQPATARCCTIDECHATGFLGDGSRLA